MGKIPIDISSIINSSEHIKIIMSDELKKAEKLRGMQNAASYLLKNAELNSLEESWLAAYQHSLSIFAAAAEGNKYE